MKITTTKTTVIAESETIAEAIQLLALSPTPPSTQKRTYKKRASRNSWKGKHRIPCDQCGKKFKNIKLHILKKHTIHDN